MSITGQLVTYTAQPPEGCELLAVQWNFGEFTQFMYSMYDPNNAFAAAMPMETFTGTQISFYYVGEGAIEYVQSITYMTPEGEELGTEVPGEDFFEAPTVIVDEIAGAPEWQIIEDAGGRSFLSLGLAEGFEGFEFVGDVELPAVEAAAGLLGFCQLVGVTLIYTPVEGQDLELNEPVPLLDTTFPYTEPGEALPGESVPIKCVDSPSYWLPEDNCSRVEVNLLFETGVVYQPAGGIWVQLGSVVWQASAVATRPEAGEPWLLLPGQGLQFGAWTPGLSLPIWNENIEVPSDAFANELAAEFGPPPPPPEELLRSARPGSALRLP